MGVEKQEDTEKKEGRLQGVLVVIRQKCISFCLSPERANRED